VLGRRRTTEVAPLLRLSRWCRRNDVDVVHCHGRPSFSLVALLAAARLVRAPIVFHDHHGHAEGAAVPRWFAIARRYLAAYVGVDEEQLAWASRAAIPRDRCHVIANAIDMRALADQRLTGDPLPASAGCQQVVFVGGLRPEKAVDVLLDAFARVRGAATLHLIGGDADRAYAERCRARAAASDLAGRVVFHGQRPDALAAARTADVAVHSSRTESGPLVLAEYAALEVPFVATRVGGIARALEAAGVGRYVPAEDPVALASALDELLACPPAERRSAAQASARTARELLDIHVTMPHWYRLYGAVRS
jgi:glycosyltransferase involved in cell wall biosynthesis